MVRKVWLGLITLFIAVIGSVIINSLNVNLHTQVAITVGLGIVIGIMWANHKDSRRY